MLSQTRPFFRYWKGWWREESWEWWGMTMDDVWSKGLIWMFWPSVFGYRWRYAVESPAAISHKRLDNQPTYPVWIASEMGRKRCCIDEAVITGFERVSGYKIYSCVGWWKPTTERQWVSLPLVRLETITSPPHICKHAQFTGFTQIHVLRESWNHLKYCRRDPCSCLAGGEAEPQKFGNLWIRVFALNNMCE